MKKILAIAAVIVVSFNMLEADTKPDIKFINKIAEQVWQDADTIFNPKADLSDSIYQDVSAVIIASKHTVDGKRNEATPFGIYKGANTQYFGETTVKALEHYMIKVLDANGVEKHSEFEFAGKEEIQATYGFTALSTKEAFGARIHKPDGSIVNVDIATALPEVAGKKEEAKNFKIAIPSLEPGDVLEYFKYIEVYFLGDQSVGQNIDVIHDYPVKNYKISSVFDKILTVEFNTFNGLGQNALTYKRGTERDTVAMQYAEMPFYEMPKYSNKARQVPYVRVKVSDNYSRVFGHLNSARRSGVYFNLTTPTIMAEVAERLSKIAFEHSEVSNINNLVNNYKKANPEASWSDIVDAAWIATTYFITESKNLYDQWDRVALFKDVLDKQNLSERVSLGVTSPQNKINIREISSYTQATPMVVVGDRFYIADDNSVYRPGDIPLAYQLEEGFEITGKRENIMNDTRMRLVADTLPGSLMRDNVEVFDIRLSLDPENPDRLKFDYTNKTTGTRRSPGGAFLNSMDIISLSEDFLKVADKKKSKRQFDRLSIDDSRRTVLEALCEIDFDLSDAKIDSVSIISPGFLPDSPSFEYAISGSVDQMVSSAGDDIILEIGHFLGSTSLKPIEYKKRDIDIWTQGPYNIRYNIKIEIPQGYTVDPESLQNIQTNVVNRTGAYFVEAKLVDEDGNKYVNVVSNQRLKYRVMQPELWSEFLKIREGMRALSDAAIIFTPVQ